jgi:hypothetical protein
MRAVFFMLLIANLALAAYAWFRPNEPTPDAELVNKQINPDKIEVIPAKPMVAPQPKAANCLEWSPFGSGELKAVQNALDALRPAPRYTLREIAVVVGYWVFIPPLPSRTEAERKMAELRRLDVREYYPVDSQGPMKNAISLGIFKTEEAAHAYLEQLRSQGVRSAQVGSREHRVMQTAVYVREPSVALTAKLAEMRLQFPGSELKEAACPS